MLQACVCLQKTHHRFYSSLHLHSCDSCELCDNFSQTHLFNLLTCQRTQEIPSSYLQIKFAVNKQLGISRNISLWAHVCESYTRLCLLYVFFTYLLLFHRIKRLYLTHISLQNIYVCMYSTWKFILGTLRQLVIWCGKCSYKVIHSKFL